MMALNREQFAKLMVYENKLNDGDDACTAEEIAQSAKIYWCTENFFVAAWDNTIFYAYILKDSRVVSTFEVPSSLVGAK